MAACPHGRRLSRCKECGGEGICEHGRERRRCKECGGAGICVHGREHKRCKECSGTSLCLCEHGQCTCKECHVSTLDVITLEATAIEECEGEEGPHFEVKSATRPEYLATLQTCSKVMAGRSSGAWPKLTSGLKGQPLVSWTRRPHSAELTRTSRGLRTVRT